MGLLPTICNHLIVNILEFLCIQSIIDAPECSVSLRFERDSGDDQLQ